MALLEQLLRRFCWQFLQYSHCTGIDSSLTIGRTRDGNSLPCFEISSRGSAGLLYLRCRGYCHGIIAALCICHRQGVPIHLADSTSDAASICCSAGRCTARSVGPRAIEATCVRVRPL